MEHGNPRLVEQRCIFMCLMKIYKLQEKVSVEETNPVIKEEIMNGCLKILEPVHKYYRFLKKLSN